MKSYSYQPFILYMILIVSLESITGFSEHLFISHETLPVEPRHLE